MTDSVKKKIEIIDISLDIDLDKEIKKQATVDTAAQHKINTILAQAKGRIKPKPIDPFDEKFEQLFILMSSKPEISKNEFLDVLNITGAQVGATIAKYKRFLRETKSNEWALVISTGRDKTYALKRP